MSATEAPTLPIAPRVAEVASRVDERHYADHDRRGRTVHRTNPVYVQRDISYLDVRPGDRVLEIGTGSGYSGALLADLAGPTGQVTSLDVDRYLASWANLTHHDRGLSTVRCHAANGLAGWPDRAPYNRIGAWCAPPLLPTTWVEQAAEDARIVTTLPVASLPELTVLAVIRITDGHPHIESTAGGGYVPATEAPYNDFDRPPYWVDWEYRHPSAAWISISWRDEDDWLCTGARTALDRLLAPGHTEHTDAVPSWNRWCYWAIATGDPGITLVDINGERALGHSTPRSAAVLTPNGKLLADSPASPSLGLLHRWIADWNAAGRPARDHYTPTLVPSHGPDGTGWNLRLAR